MAHHRPTGKNADRPRTAAEEVLAEFEEAETDVRDDARPGDGEAADALTPSRSAQEDARRRAEDHRTDRPEGEA
ncbi:hypothetical protein [Streptomyces sp. NPDC001744]|uniref:hypothetical protein n=1 Tax=Streptomyces sp. NPDC001744 TaxID=3364606 RepID=UPI0036BC746D